MGKMQEVLKTKVITGLVRFSYLHVWTPVAIDEGGQLKYSVSLIIPKSDKKTIKDIKQAINNAKTIGKDTKFGGKIPPNLKLPLRDGDEDREEDEVYENCYFVNAVSRTKPGIVNKELDVILNPEEVYSGCYGRASISFYPFKVSGNIGIACGLNHIQKLKDGEMLGGRAPVENDFEEEYDGDLDDDDDDML